MLTSHAGQFYINIIRFMVIKTNLNMEDMEELNTTIERLRDLSLNEITNPSLMEAQREETVLPSLPSSTPNPAPPRDLPSSSREEGIKNFELAALRELNSKVTTRSMPIDNSGELNHTVTSVEIANQSDLERLMDMVGNSTSYNVTLSVARFELPEEAGCPATSVVAGTGAGFYWECPRTGEAPAVMDTTTPRDFGVREIGQDQIRSEQGAQLEMGEAPGVMESSRQGDFGVREIGQNQIRSEQGAQLEMGGLSYFVDTGLPVKECCSTTTTVTLGEQSDTLDHIEDMVSGLILKADSWAATAIHASLGIMTLNSLPSVFLGLAVCFGMAKVFVFIEGRYLQACQTKKTNQILLWFSLRQYFKSYYFASLILIASIMVWNGIHKNNLHKKVTCLEYDLPTIPVIDFPCALPFLSRVAKCYKMRRKESLTYNMGIQCIMAVQIIPLILAGLTYGSAFRYTLQTKGLQNVSNNCFTLLMAGFTYKLLSFSAEYNRDHFYMPRMLERVESKQEKPLYHRKKTNKNCGQV